MVYALGDRDADLLAERFGFDRGNVRWNEKNESVKRRYLLHTLMISDFRVCLSLSLEETSGAQLLFWKCKGQAVLKDSVQVRTRQGSSKRLPIVPGRYFCIEDEGGNMYFFLEADRSTMTNSRFLRKIRAYWKWWKKGGHTNKIDIQAFRVLTITKSEKRTENLRTTSRKADDQQRGSAMFWFTSEENYSLEALSEALEPMWRTPKRGDENFHHLLE